MSEYVVVYEQADDGGWGASLPDLPGVFALGATRDEVTARITEAVALYAEMMSERGQPLPVPASQAGTVRI